MARLCRLPREIVAALAIATFAAACGAREPQTDAERLARGREIVERMSATLAGAKAFKVTTVETRQEAGRAGTIRKVTLTRETSVRRPDRLYSKATGDRQQRNLVRRRRHHAGAARGQGVRAGASARNARQGARRPR